MSDPRFQPGGRFFYGDGQAMLAELRAAGVTKNDHGPIDKPDKKKRGKRKPAQPLGVLSGMVEKVRQRAGFQLADWRSAGSRTLKRPSPCAICGGTIQIGEIYHRGAGHRAHRSCVKAWSKVGDDHGRKEGET
jgi:hypothetical protein